MICSDQSQPCEHGKVGRCVFRPRQLTFPQSWHELWQSETAREPLQSGFPHFRHVLFFRPFLATWSCIFFFWKSIRCCARFVISCSHGLLTRSPFWGPSESELGFGGMTGNASGGVWLVSSRGPLLALETNRVRFNVPVPGKYRFPSAWGVETIIEDEIKPDFAWWGWRMLVGVGGTIELRLESWIWRVNGRRVSAVRESWVRTLLKAFHFSW